MAIDFYVESVCEPIGLLFPIDLDSGLFGNAYLNVIINERSIRPRYRRSYFLRRFANRCIRPNDIFETNSGDWN